MNQDQYDANRCRDCGETLFELKGDWYCPHCDSVSGFVLDEPDYDFEL